MAKQDRSICLQHVRYSQLIVVDNTWLRTPGEMQANYPTPKSIKDYMKKSAQFGYGRTWSSCLLVVHLVFSTHYRGRHMVENTLGDARKLPYSKIHWGLYEKKCSIWLWQNWIVLFACSTSRAFNPLSWKTHGWEHRMCWKQTTLFQNPWKIIWEKVPNLVMAKHDHLLCLQYFRCSQLAVMDDTWLRLPRRCKQTTLFQNLLRIIWEKVPNLAKAE